MKSEAFVLYLLLLFCLACSSPGDQTKTPPVEDSLTTYIPVLPIPKTVGITDQLLKLPDTIWCSVTDARLQPLMEVIDYEYHQLTGGRFLSSPPSGKVRFELSIDTAYQPEAYRVQSDYIVGITGGSYQAVAMGSVTWMQTLQQKESVWLMPIGSIEDQPDVPFRGLLVDVAREWHDVSTLRQLILLCRWYKINYMQLHLTDDNAFTFPTETFPRLPTPGHHYTKDELRQLDIFARDHGVTLIPELEMPGHGGQFTSRMPAVFAIRDRQKNQSTINMGNEAVYEALDKIIGEMAEVFQTTPYFHIGGDEAGLQQLEKDPAVKRYMAENDLENVPELYRHFLVRMHEVVKKHGKQTILWEGFHKEGKVEIPKDIIVMAWETLYQTPQDLLTDGYTLINVSWKPLYVVNQRKWEPAYIYNNWNLYRWENFLPQAPSYQPIQLEPTPQVMGAMMAAWEQPQTVQLPTLRKRLAAMSERSWNVSVEPKRPFSAFARRLAHTDAVLQNILSPVEIQAKGLRFPDLEDGRYHEQHWFDDSLVVQLRAKPGQVVYYTLDGSLPAPDSLKYNSPVILKESASLRAKAYTASGNPAGYDVWHVYQFRPLEASIEGNLQTPMAELWEQLNNREVVFTDTVTITLSHKREGILRYTINGSEPASGSPVYQEPIRLSRSGIVKAQLFSKEGKKLGYPWEQHFRKDTP